MKVIFDLDGTLADCTHRLQLIDGKKQWDKFHSECINDKPIESMIILLEAMFCVEDYEIIFLTTRPESSRDLTCKWIEKNAYFLFNDYQLLMRKSRDYRPDDVVKLEILEREGITPDEVLFIVEDRTRVVKALREKGYKVLQCAEGDY